MEVRLIFLLTCFSLCSAIPRTSNSVASQISKDNAKPTEEDMFWGLNIAKEKYQHPEMPFKTNAMEPYIDAATMEVHYNKIFQGYVVKLNALLKKMKAEGGNDAKLAETSLINIWRNRRSIKGNGLEKGFSYYAGGYMNHLIYFSTMTPNPKGEERNASERMIKLIDKSFHNMTMMIKDFDMMSKEMFGSGWVYLALATGYSSGLYLTIMPTVEEFIPLDIKGIYPILALDLWEHAYFKKYGNTRREYVKNWWKTVDWVKVERIMNWWEMVEPHGIKHVDL